MATASKPKCKYWGKCYRKDATHVKGFRHPADDDDHDSEDSGTEAKQKTVSLKGKKVVFTGALSGQTRKKAAANAETYGCIVTKAVSSKTDIVVVGEGAGQKIDNATELGIEVYEEDDWLELLDSATPVSAEDLPSKGKAEDKSDSEEEMEVSTDKPKTSPSKKPGSKRAAAQVHDISDSEDDGPTPAKKAKEQDVKAANPTPKKRKTSRRKKCTYWDKCFRKEATHLKTFRHPDDSDTSEEEMDTGEGPSGEKSVKQKNTMADGESVEIKGGLHGEIVYRIKRTGDDYYCTCAGWKNQKKAVDSRTCRHLQIHLGEDFEKGRVGDTGAGWAGSDMKRNQRAPRHKNIGSLLLAHKWTESQNPKGWWLSEKLDGVRAFWDGKAFYSRLGNEFIPPAWFIKDFPSDMELDGELFGGRGKFQSTVSIVKNAGSDAWNKIKYMIFDAPHLKKEPFEKRHEACEKYFDEHEVKYAEVLKQEKCRGFEHLKEEQDRVEGLGGEGLMIREPGSKYEHARSKTLLKIKTFHDAEALVIGHEKGKGQNSHRCGAIRCRMECGKEFSVGTGLSNKDRDHPPKKGSIITYKFQEYTNSGSPRFPVFIGLRIDLDAPKDVILPPKPE